MGSVVNMELEEPHVLLYFDVNKVSKRVFADLIMCALRMRCCVGDRLMQISACALSIRR